MDEKHENLNLRLAEIDGKCACDESVDGGGYIPNYCIVCKKPPRPDYLAPENLHELVRVAEERWEHIELLHSDGWSVFLKEPVESTRRNRQGLATTGYGSDPDSLSAALAKAIVEAKG